MVGALVARRAKERGIAQVVFDKGGYKYHGRVKAFAEAAARGRTGVLMTLSFDQRGRGDPSEQGLTERVVKIRRVTKVVKGGRRRGFSVMVVVGDGEGRVGMGLGKAYAVPGRRAKGRNHSPQEPGQRAAQGHDHSPSDHGKPLRVLPCSSSPRRPARGVIAGGAVRAVVESAGIRDILTKSLGSANAINVVRATIDGLTRLKDPEREIALRKGEPLPAE